MPKVAFFDCFSGCSGDMILGALLDAGLPFEALETGLSSLGVQGYRLSLEKVKKASITASYFNVKVSEVLPQPDRSLASIIGLINASTLPEKVKKNSAAVFQRLGEIEAQIHGVALEQVHFHEIGAVDSIIDIVGTVLALEILKIERVYCSPLPVGKGSVTTAHGVLPVPAPATLQILALAKAPITENLSHYAPQGELVTPTGAVLLTMFADFRRPSMKLEKIGYGAGTRDFPNWPNVLRIWIGQEAEDAGTDNLVLLETNIDDMSPQIYGYLMEKLLAEKALDVWFTPIQMKKNRPAVMLSVLAPAHAEGSMTNIIMRETSTLGVRVRPVSRHTASREIIEFESSMGHVRVKVKRFSGEAAGLSPEYDDCRRIALERGLPLQEAFRIIQEEARAWLDLVRDT